MIDRRQIHDFDKELVKRFLRIKDEATFGQLYDRHSPALYLLALRLVGGSENDAQDILQDTWVRACKKLGAFEWNSSLRTWLSGILINCSRELGRKFRKRNEEVLQDELPLGNSKGSHVRADLIDLERVIRDLPDGYRQALILHDLEGYTHKEISGLLGINEGTSKSQLFNARKSVRKSFQTEKESRDE